MKLPVLVVIFICFGVMANQDPIELDKEISRLRKELAQIQIERDRNKIDMHKDSRDADEYTSRAQKRLQSVVQEIDDFKKQIAGNKAKLDSLSAVLSNIQSGKRQIELSQENFRKTLELTCDMFLKSAFSIPPSIRNNSIAAVSLIKSELNAKTVENVEAVNRLTQISLQLEESSRSIQVSQENSPIPEIRGAIYRIRLGTFYEAIVDIKGEHAVIWSGYNSDGLAAWKSVENTEQAMNILKTAQIREGKSLPDFGHIPFISNISTSSDSAGVTK
jgi:hypothetical protein